jgi:hypothetical protein
MRAQGPSPVACTLCHLYGFEAVSRAQASARGCGARRQHRSAQDTVCSQPRQTATYVNHLVAVVSAENEEKALPNEGQHVCIPRPWTLTLDNLRQEKLSDHLPVRRNNLK